MQEIIRLDSKDAKIINGLFDNSRVSSKELKKKINASKEVINYRIKNLLKENIIINFSPIINFAITGYSTYRLQLQFKEKNEQEWYEFFKAIKQTSWIVQLQGSWDLAVLFWIKNNKEFFEILESTNKKFGSNILKKTFVIIDKIYVLSPNYLYALQSTEKSTAIKEKNKNMKEKSIGNAIENKRIEKNRKYYIIGKQGENIALDETDNKLIEELNKDARVPILQLSKKLNISATNLNYHLKKLISSNLIEGFIPIINYEKLNLTHIKVNLMLTNPETKNTLKSILINNLNTIYITESYGNYDLEFEYLANNTAQLLNFIEEISKKVSIREYETIYTKKEILVNRTPV